MMSSQLLKMLIYAFHFLILSLLMDTDTSSGSSISFSNFSIGSNTLQRPTYRACGVYVASNNGISLIGGAESEDGRQRIGITIGNHSDTVTFHDLGEENLNYSLIGYSTFCIQHSDSTNMMFSIGTKPQDLNPPILPRIFVFNLSDTLFSASTLVDKMSFDPNNSHIDSNGNGYDSICMTFSTQRGGELILIGGHVESGVSGYSTINISTGHWTEGPILNQERIKPLCIADDDTATLYAIGGEGRSNIEYIQLDDPSSSWVVLSHNLPSVVCCGKALLYDSYIFLVGGESRSHPMEIYMISRYNLSIRIPTGFEFNTERVGASPIIVGDVMYMFSGRDVSGSGLTSWEYVSLPTESPTKSPSLSPTITEYIFIGSPSNKPTTPPSISPTIKPTMEPTMNPSENPTFEPTTEPNTFIVSTPMQWDEAETYCLGLNGHLLSIHNNETQKEVEDLCATLALVNGTKAIGSWGCWIGLYATNDSDREWQWSDGSTLDFGFNTSSEEPLTGIHPWYGDQPDNDNNEEDCVYLHWNHQDWRDLNCINYAFPICTSLWTPNPSVEPSIHPTDIQTTGTFTIATVPNPSVEPTDRLTNHPTEVPTTDWITIGIVPDPTIYPTSYPTYNNSTTQYSNFSIGNTALSRWTFKGCVGYSFSNNSVWILSGTEIYNQLQALSFNLQDYSTTDYGTEAIEFAFTGYSQYFTQINHTLYIIDSFSWLLSFDLETMDFNFSVVENVPPSIPHKMWLPEWSCLTSDANRGYIFWIDGIDSTLMTLRLPDGEWMQPNGSSLNQRRDYLICIFDDKTDTLYAIGGDNRSDVEVLNTALLIESNGTNTTGWSTLTEKLPEVVCCGRAFLYRDDILVIGSNSTWLDVPDSFYIIERFGGHSMYTATGLSMVIPRIGSSAVIVDDVLYLISGQDAKGNGLLSWEYVYLSGTTMNPTTTPTPIPSVNPIYVNSSAPNKSIMASGTAGEISFDPHSAGISDQKITLATVVIIGCTALCVLITLIDARCLRYNDFFRQKFVTRAILGFLDVFLDAAFAVRMIFIYLHEHSFEVLIVVICSLSFIVLPIALSLLQLLRATNKWRANDRINGWLIDNAAMLFLMSIVTGSSFNAISVVNCNAFKMQAFSMGLTRKEMLQWNNQKIWSITFLENMPQLGIQLWYLITYGTDLVAISSILFSMISIVIAVFSIAAKFCILRHQHVVSIQFDVIGSGVHRGMTRTRRIKKGFGPILMVDPRVIDFEYPMRFDDGDSEGMRLKMLAYVNRNLDDMKSRCEKGISNGGFARVCQKAWNLKSLPRIRDLQCEVMLTDEQRQNLVTIKAASPMSLQHPTTFEMVQSLSSGLEDPPAMLHENSGHSPAAMPAPGTPGTSGAMDTEGAITMTRTMTEEIEGVTSTGAGSMDI